MLKEFLGGIWGYVGAAVLAAFISAGATYAVVHTADTVKLQAEQLAHGNDNLANSKQQVADVAASLGQLQGFITNMHTADAGYGAALATIHAQFAALDKELKNATAAPLPADCRPDAGRLRVLTDAVAAAAAHAADPVPGP